MVDNTIIMPKLIATGSPSLPVISVLSQASRNVWSNTRIFVFDNYVY